MTQLLEPDDRHALALMQQTGRVRMGTPDIASSGRSGRHPSTLFQAVACWHQDARHSRWRFGSRSW